MFGFYLLLAETLGQMLGILNQFLRFQRELIETHV
jgi:hypothetical protein